MNSRELLRVMEAIKLGSDVAEHESDLSGLFVTDNEAYRRLVRDEVDVIGGGKGTGKSAIFRMITETPIRESLHVVKASNPTAAPEFRALFQGNDSEERLRSIWAAYVTSLIGNYVVDKFGRTTTISYMVDEIREVLELMGLRTPEPKKEGLLSRIRRAKSVEGGAKGGVAGLELGVALRFELPDATDGEKSSSVILNYPDFFTLLQKCADVLQAEGSQVWIAFDRLDECFVHDSPVEHRALRALLRTHLDCSEALNHTGWIRLKIFLRTDMLTRMTTDGAFTNATHLRRAELAWTFSSMKDLIARRLIRNEAFVDVYLKELPLAEWVDAAWDSFLPIVNKSASNSGPPATMVTRLVNNTADGSRLFNPRNLITLLTMSLDRARQNLRRDIRLERATRDATPLIRQPEIDSALGELSRRRYQDTVLNEFPSVQQYADKLRGGTARYGSVEELMARLEVPHDAVATAVDLLTLSGLIGTANGEFIVPRLYRAALSAKMPK